MAKLGDVCTVYAGTGFPIKYQGCTEGEFPFYKVGDIAKNVIKGFSFLNLCDNYIDSEVCTTIKGTIIPSGTVVFAKIGEAVKLNRRAITSSPCLIDNNAMGIKPDESIVSLNYFYYFMCHIKLEKYAEATTVPSVKKSIVETIEIPLPPLETQKQIAATLDKVTALIDMHKRQLELLEELVKGRFVEMFGDVYTNTHGFPIYHLSDYILFLTSGSRGWAKYCVDDGSEWFITIKNVKDCKISTDNIQPVNAPDNMEAKRTKVEEDDLLISITADLGRTGVVTKEIAEHGAYINQHLTCIRLNKSELIPLYVAYFMESNSGRPQFEAKNQTGVKAGLNFDSIKSLKVLIPPLELQTQFAAFVTQTDKSKASIQQSLAKLETLKKSLMQEYFG